MRDSKLRRRIGLFGGTFDPPHRGHLGIAQEALSQLELEEVLLVVAGNPYQKQDRVITDGHERLTMVELLIAETPGLSANAMELNRSGPSYTIDTVEALLAAGQEQLEIVLIIGADLAEGLDQWHRAEELAALVEVAVVLRPGFATPQMSKQWAWSVLHVAPNSCSSSGVRSDLLHGRDVANCLPPAILHHVETHCLYDGSQ